MTKFETIGCENQYTSRTKDVASKRFTISCYCCCNKGLHIDCDRCAIAVAHSLVVASFENKISLDKEVVHNG